MIKIFLTILIFSTIFISCTYFSSPYSYKLDSPNYHLKRAQRTKPEKVKTLNLHHYKDSIFPNKDIMNFTSLESIIISGAIRIGNLKYPKLYIDTILLKKLPNLKYLGFSRFDFKNFPKELLALENLKALSLDVSNINKLPKEINKLQKLEFLSLRLNNLKTLPNSIILMDSLKVLDLGNNLFNNLPEILINPNNLEYINFANPEGSGTYKKYVTPTNEINYIKEKNTLEKVVNQTPIKRVSIEVNSCENKKYLKNSIGDKLGMGCKDCGDCNFKL